MKFDIESWDLFVTGHYARHYKAGLPDPLQTEGEFFYSAWRAVAEKAGVTLNELDEASVELVGRRGVYPSEHMATMVEIARARRKSRSAEYVSSLPQSIGVDEKRDQIKASSWDRLDEQTREEVREMVRADNPHISRWPHFIECIAIERHSEYCERIARGIAS